MTATTPHLHPLGAHRDERAANCPPLAVLVPTLNAGARWSEWISALEAQTCRPSRVLVLDSASTDQTVQAALVAGFDVVPIARQHFSHGGTRQLGVGLLEQSVKFIVLLTQDAVLADSKALEKLLGVNRPGF